MYPIVRKETLADNIILMDIKAPRVANECLPGQFIIAKTDEVGERIPLTICDYDRVRTDIPKVQRNLREHRPHLRPSYARFLRQSSVPRW